MAKGENISRGERGRFKSELSPGTVQNVIRAVLFSKQTIRQIAAKFHVSPAYVTKVRDSFRPYKETAPHLNSREAALLEREYRVLQEVFRICNGAIQQKKPIPSAAKIRPIVNDMLSNLDIGTVSLKMINCILDKFAAEGMIPPRTKPGPRKKFPFNSKQDKIVELISRNPAVSNAELLQETGLTLQQLNHRLRALRDLGVLHTRKRPGGKPFRKRRFSPRRK